jgi:hypothetical protein
MENNYYVYCHKIKETGKVFYIGKGRLNRAWQMSSRSKVWKQVFETQEIEIEILAENLTNEAALVLEKDFIHNPKDNWQLVNTLNQSSVIRKLDKNFFAQYLDYSETSPSGLIWKIIPGNGNQIGDRAGVLGPNKRWMVKVKGVSYLAHRLVYLLEHGNIIEGAILDHIDGDSTNNKIENLREVTFSQNSKNRKVNVTDDMKHICYVENKPRGPKAQSPQMWLVQWQKADGQRKNKSFCITKTRSKEEALTLAKAFRDDLIKQGLILTRGI